MFAFFFYFFGINMLIIFAFLFSVLSSRSSHIRSLPVFKPAGSPTANRDAELYAPYRIPPRAACSTNSSSCNSSPTSRYQTCLFIWCIIKKHRRIVVLKF